MTDTGGEQVFVSSTVYDLIDVRAEVFEHLREMGLRPSMSDKALSDFTVAPDDNSIRSCIINLDKSDIVILILSQRYGGILPGGFGAISATELEYSRAISSGKPIYVFARDRLEADWGTWKVAQESGGEVSAKLKLPWAKPSKEGSNWRILEFLDRIKRLPEDNSNKPNWVSTFADSVDLKAQLSKALGAQARKATLRRMIAEQKLPFFRLRAVLTGGPVPPAKLMSFIFFQNLTSVPVEDAHLTIREGNSTTRQKAPVRPHKEDDMQILVSGFKAPLHENDITTQMYSLTYILVTGQKIEDRYSAERIPSDRAEPFERVRFVLKERILLEDQTFQIGG